MRCQVAIIGAGPSGLLLGQLLQRSGIDALIIERSTPEHVLSRVRAGVLEQGTVELIRSAGAGARCDRDGLVHSGIEIAFAGARHRIDLRSAANGRPITIYGQTELTRDLMDARRDAGAKTVYGATDVELHDFDTDRPEVSYSQDGVQTRVTADFICGCDGFRGASRQAIPARAMQVYDKSYPISWLGLLADTPPVAEELVYASSDRGFALCSMRSATRSRFYLQTAETDQPADWSDDAFWSELRRRLPDDLAASIRAVPSIEKSSTKLRSSVTEPLRFNRLFLCGDAGHIVPPIGAKGLNLAASDVHYLVEALLEYYADGSAAALDRYSHRALARVWKAEYFCWWMTNLFHLRPDADAFETRLQTAELDYLTSSPSAQTSLAENYVGTPF
ncbi:MAG: 4-hydroxybenzoate 3-monooxygenase [Devosia sp.]